HRRAGRAGAARDGHRQDVEPGGCLRDLLLLRAVFVLELLQQALHLRPQPRSDGGDQSGAVHAAAHRQTGGGQLYCDKLSGRGVVPAGGLRVAVVDGDLSFEEGESGGVTMRARQKRELDRVSPRRRGGAENAKETRQPLRSPRLRGAMASCSQLLAFLPIAFLTIAANAETLTVGPSPARFQTIQSPIAAAKSGDTIQVQPGAYTGRFILDKQLAIEGVGKPVLRGEGRGSVVIMIADRCSIRGFVIEHSGGDLQAEDSGLLLKSNENTVAGNELRDTLYGIYLYHSQRNMIRGNTVRGRRELEVGSRGAGLHL